MEQYQFYTSNNLAWCTNENVGVELKKQLALHGFRCFELSATNIVDASSFVRELVTHLPCDPDYYEFHDEQEVNWAAVEDSLFGGLTQEESNVAIFWYFAERLIEQYLNLIFQSIDILFSIARSRNFAIKIFFVGKGPNFDPW